MCCKHTNKWETRLPILAPATAKTHRQNLLRGLSLDGASHILVLAIFFVLTGTRLSFRAVARAEDFRLKLLFCGAEHSGKSKFITILKNGVAGGIAQRELEYLELQYGDPEPTLRKIVTEAATYKSYGVILFFLIDGSNEQSLEKLLPLADRVAHFFGDSVGVLSTYLILTRTSDKFSISTLTEQLLANPYLKESIFQRVPVDGDDDAAATPSVKRIVEDLRRISYVPGGPDYIDDLNVLREQAAQFRSQARKD